MGKTRIGNETKHSKHSKNSNKKIKNYGFRKFLIFILWIGIIGCLSGLFLLYGPYDGFRNWYVATAMETMRHQYLAKWFYDDQTIEEIMERNRVIEVLGTTDSSQIHFSVDDNKGPFENEYEEAVLKRSDKNNDYKIIRIQEDKFTGYLTVIYDPYRIKLVTTSKLGVSGEYLTEISKMNKSLVAINAGGFEDEGGDGNGSIPTGTTISDRKDCFR